MSEEMDEIWQLYADDGGQSLDTVEENLVFLKENPGAEADIGALFRAVHTFKGNCRVLGLKVIESRAHRAEDLIGLVRDDGASLDAEMLALLLECLDALRGMLEESLASHADADETATCELVARMRDKFDRCKAQPSLAAAPEPLKAPEPQPEPAPAPAPEPSGEQREGEPQDAATPTAVEAIVFEPVSESSLAEDPMYRNIFAEMAHDMLSEMRRAIDAFQSSPDWARAALAAEVKQLSFAAGRIGLQDWTDKLADFLALEECRLERAEALVERLTAMFERDFGTSASVVTEETPSAERVPAPNAISDADNGEAADVAAPSQGALSETVAKPEPARNSAARSSKPADLAADEEGRAGSTPMEGAAEDIGSDGLFGQDTMSAAMLESIGAIITGQAAAHQTLAEIAEDDLVRAVDLKLRSARGDWSAARESVMLYLAGLQEKIEKLVQVESQVHSLLNRLQEEAIDVRNRPSALLLRPLALYGESLARRCLRNVVVTTSGDETPLDIGTLKSLAGPLRVILGFSIQQSIETPARRIAAGKDECGRVAIGLAKHDDQVTITLEDDGAGIDRAWVARRASELGWRDGGDPLQSILREGFGPVGADDSGGEGANFCEIQAELRARGGGLHIAERPSGGTRFVITAPLAMIALDGMVVRVGKVMYIVPVDSVQRIVHSDAGDLVRISAADGRYMLKLAHDDVVPIQFLMQRGHADEGDVSDPFSTDRDTAAAAQHGDPADGEGKQKRIFVVAGKSTRRIALPVDELVGQQMVLNRPLQGYLSNIRGVTGCALLGGGGVGMVLDMGYVLGHA